MVVESKAASPNSGLLRYEDGVHLAGTIMWFDARRRRELCFVSYASSARLPAHQRILCTHATASLCGHHLQGAAPLVVPFGQPFSLGSLSLELFPSGRMLGAAQIKIIHAGLTTVYAGHVQMAAARTAERLQIRRCDTLILGCRYGDPAISFPPRSETEARIVDWVAETIQDGRTPVFLVRRLGKAQELLDLLESNFIKVRTHRSIYALSRIYREYGVSFTQLRRFRGTPARDEAVIWPLDLRNSPTIGRMRRPLRFAVCTGEAAIDPTAVLERHRADEAFPLSSHSDHQGLLSYVEATGAKDVYLFDGQIHAFMPTLRKLGVQGHALTPPEQLSLI